MSDEKRWGPDDRDLEKAFDECQLALAGIKQAVEALKRMQYLGFNYVTFTTPDKDFGERHIGVLLDELEPMTGERMTVSVERE